MNNQWGRVVWFLGAMGALFLSVFFVADCCRVDALPESIAPAPITIADDETPIEEEKVEQVAPEPAPLPRELPERYLIPDVPFTVQAPSGQWGDPIFQDACEEASLIMAHAWVSGGVLTAAGVTAEIRTLAALQKKVFGHSVDTSIQDTAWLLEAHFGIMTDSVRADVTIEDIREALAAHELVIVPTDGRLLKNPNFTSPGPTRHMLVIVGYDMVTGEFIVNDPGTRRGEGYRYPEAVLYEAILDYPTGEHVEATSTDKVMLVVGQ